MLFKFLLCYALIPQHRANYAHCFTPIMSLLYSIVQVSTHHKPVSFRKFGLYDSFSYKFLYAQDRPYTWYARWILQKHHVLVSTVRYCSWLLDSLLFKPIMPALCWLTKTAYYAQSNASILCLSPLTSTPECVSKCINLIIASLREHWSLILCPAGNTCT